MQNTERRLAFNLAINQARLRNISPEGLFALLFLNASADGDDGDALLPRAESAPADPRSFVPLTGATPVTGAGSIWFFSLPKSPEPGFLLTEATEPMVSCFASLMPINHFHFIFSIFCEGVRWTHCPHIYVVHWTQIKDFCSQHYERWMRTHSWSHCLRSG